MFVRPRPLIRTPRVSRIRLLRAKLGLSCVRLRLEEFGVVVNRLVQLVVAVIEVRRFRGVEVDAPLILLEPYAGDFQRWIVSIMDDYLQRLRPDSPKIERGLLKINLLPVTHHVHPCKLSGCAKPVVFPVLNLNLTLKIGKTTGLAHPESLHGC